MSAQIERKRFTVDDWGRMEDAGILSPEERLELINGEFIVIRPPSSRHGAAVNGVCATFTQSLGVQTTVWGQSAVILHDLAAPLPDVTLLAPRSDYYAGKNPGPSDVFLIIEVSDSTLEYDLAVKRPLYAIARIPEYWVADLRNNRLLVHSKPVGDSYSEVRELHRGETVAPLLFPECKIAVDLLLP